VGYSREKASCSTFSFKLIFSFAQEQLQRFLNVFYRWTTQDTSHGDTYKFRGTTVSMHKQIHWRKNRSQCLM
ncbi:unnamed protein product, partial [Callosobruchus maculatus]